MRLKSAHRATLRAGWWLASLAAAGVAAAWMTAGGERDLLLTGPLSDAHHQIGTACESCHAGLGFDTCADCHNYHDNRALYADFLVKNAHQPWLADDPVHALSARQRTLSAPAFAPLALSDAIAPATALADPAIASRWAGSGHALSSLNCGACHGSHAADTREAAVEACASCHNDAHTLAYFGSPHHALWEAELSGDGPPGSGVSCATCHMPRTERRGTVVVSHNQNDNLRPNEKMIRTVCLDCHGLGFSLDSLADPDLVARNFNGRPSAHIESIEWALRQVSPDAPR